MERNFMTQARSYLSSRQRRKIGYKILFCLAAVVVFATVYALVLPAITLSNELLCGKEAHAHTEACWAMAEAQPRPELICEFMRTSDTVIHEHNQYCYDSDGKLICRLPEIEAHIHGPECYQQRRTLICEESQEVGHEHTSACYSHVRGELICTETGGHTHTDACYTEHETRTLTCTIPEEPGHVHGPECYEERSSEPVLTCTIPESEAVLDEEGHTVEEGHTHGDSCYETETESVLICGLSEGGGHQHDDSCYEITTEKVLTCNLPESEEHVHNDNCYNWEEQLICHEQERPSGHIHTDECYEVEDILVCREEEIIPHTHTLEECYTLVESTVEGGEDEYVLTCTQPEVLVHDHTGDCVYVPETVAEETVPTLICGLEEHEHTEACYMEVYPEDTVQYFCGLAEHEHTEECYFENSGELRCNMAVHHHDDLCQNPDLWQDTPNEVEEVEGIELDRDFTVKTADGYFEVTFHVTGYAPVASGEPVDGTEDTLPDEDGEESDVPPGEEIPDGAETDGTETDSGLAPSPNTPPPSTAPAQKPAEEPSPAPEPEPEPEPEPVEPPVQEPEPEAPLVINPSPAPEAEEQPQPSREEQLLESGLSPAPLERGLLRRLRTLLPGDGSDGLDADADAGVSVEEVEITLMEEEVEPPVESPATASEEGEEPAETEEVELIPARKLSFKAMLGGRELDLSQCEITVSVSLAPDLVAALENRESAVQTLDETENPDIADTSNKPDTILKTTVQDADGIVTYSETTAVNETSTGTNDISMQSDDSIILEVLDSVYPKYNIEFYAYIQRPVWDTDPSYTIFQLWEKDRKEYLSLPFIDTSGEHKLPTNQKNQETKYLEMTNGKVDFEEELTQLYQTAKNQIYTPGLGLTVPELDLVNKATGEALQTEHYDRKELWVLEPGYTTDDGQWIAFTTDESLKDKDGYEYVGEDSSRWTKYTTDLESLKFTNTDPKNTETPDDKTIVIKTGTTLRVVYQAKGETDAHQNEAAFYDYDISDGKIYTSAENAAAGKNGSPTKGQQGGKEYYLNTKEQGINSPANYKGEGAKLAFGNDNTDSNLGKVTWSGNNINKTNPATGDNNSPGTGFGCTFGMVNGISSTGGLTFKSGITAPELFGTGEAVGKTPYGDYQLHFDRMGDTYTLTSVSDASGKTVSSGLDSFHHPQAKYRHIWTNDFWPMDGVATHGGNGHDAKFGGTLGGENYGNVKTYVGGNHNLPAADDGVAHNSYFGMQFSIEFNLPETYMGPLEYFFYGDDDLWVFLDNELVCDIGGVHSSIGEYVDLWDYLRDKTTGKVDAGNHVLSFYYAERGASGSTCWMQYTLPNIASLPTEVKYGEKESLKVTKLVEGDQNQVPEGPFDFTIRLTGVTDSYQTNLQDENGNPRKISPDEDFKFTLANGESLTIKDLPAHAQYQIVETSEGLTNCHPRISVVSMGNGQDQELDGKYEIGGAVGSGAEVTYTNAFYYELPSTGGPGLPWHTLGGGLLLAAGCLWYRKKPWQEGAVD